MMIGPTVTIGRRRRRSGGGGSLPVVPLGGLITFYGDGTGSEGAAPGVRNWPAWALQAMGGSIMPSEGWMQCKSGETLDGVFARRHAALKQAPNIFVYASDGHNDGLKSSGWSAQFTKWERNLDAVVAGLPSTTRIVVMPTLWTSVSGETTGGNWQQIVRDAQVAKVTALQAIHGARIILFNWWTAINSFGPYDFTTGANASDNNVHANAFGGWTLGSMLAEILKPHITTATTDAILADAAAKTWRGANIYAERAYTGTTGALAGGVAPTGQVATTHTLTNNLANGTGVTVTAAKVAQSGYDQQRITVSGTPAAAQTIRFARSSNMTITGGAPGTYFAFMCGLRIENGSGGPAAGLDNFGLSLGSPNALFSNANLGAFGFSNPLPAVIDGVFLCPPDAWFANDTAVAPPTLDFNFDAVALSAQITIERPQVFQLYTNARTAPWYIGDDTIVGANFQARLTGTGVTGAGLPSAGTITAATVTTVRVEPGNWSGGGLTFSRVMRRNGAVVSGAFSTGWTYAMGGQVVAGDVIAIDVTATNSFGSETRTLTFNVV